MSFVIKEKSSLVKKDIEIKEIKIFEKQKYTANKKDEKHVSQ